MSRSHGFLCVSYMHAAACTSLLDSQNVICQMVPLMTTHGQYLAVAK